MKLPSLAVALLCGLSLAIASPTGTTFAQGDDHLGGGPPPFVRAKIAFIIFDANRDGALAESEVPSFVWDHLSPADANEDGSVTREELKTMAASKLFDKFDENEDGSLTEDEVPAPVWWRLSRADADEDGSITQEEFISAEHPGRGGPPSDG